VGLLLLIVMAVAAISPRAAGDDSKAKDKNVSGAGAIDRVIATGAEPVFRVDGYFVRVNSGTETHFGEGLTALSDVGMNTWVHFEGRRNDAGVVLAAKASFVKPKAPKRKRDPLAIQVTALPAGSLIDFNGHFQLEPAKQRPEDKGGKCGWYLLQRDAAEQERLRRIGMRLVPQYQRDLADDDPNKIPFRFYVVDEPEIREDMFCNEGEVLVPAVVMERLPGDQELAAVVADGVAANVARHQARTMLDWGLIAAADAGAGVTGILIVNHEIERKMEEERGRVALGLLADAGYDPWQAPEAWRLLAPGRLPKNIDNLKYPGRSKYQQDFLDLQYEPAARAAHAAKIAGAASAPADSH
jgi:hypothetical protein